MTARVSMNPDRQPYRMVPDQQARIAAYRTHRFIGKLFLVLGLFLSLPWCVGMTRENSAFGVFFLVPIALMAGLAWKGFPAFSRCPGCRKPMKSRSKDGKTVRQGRFFDEISPHRAYLVCDHCQLYAFLGEYRNG